jgi:hypothetical protein
LTKNTVNEKLTTRRTSCNLPKGDAATQFSIGGEYWQIRRRRFPRPEKETPMLKPLLVAVVLASTLAMSSAPAAAWGWHRHHHWHHCWRCHHRHW